MKRWLIALLSLTLCMPVQAKEEPKELYAQSAVLMDAESGRVLFGKNETDVKAMASTTKIMTCILALENSDMNQVVKFSDEAAKQPKVHLGASAGEEFYVKDLLYSLMLESHNDSAVAIAETVAGSVKEFAMLMNQKAEEIGCKDTYFITPNGLDASDENGVHSTTATDLAKIMSYCIMKSPQKDDFLMITQTQSYQFSNLEGKRSYHCTNHNTFLSMMDEAISGKTGFTADAGYCYVGAVQSEGRTFVVSLLACGWPNNKNYKWKDMRNIIAYGMQNYHYRELPSFPMTDSLCVNDGIPDTQELFGDAIVTTEVEGTLTKEMLLHQEEQIDISVIQEDVLTAPVKKGQQVGEVIYTLNGEVVATYPIVTTRAIKKNNFAWSFRKIWKMFAMCV